MDKQKQIDLIVDGLTGTLLFIILLITGFAVYSISNPIEKKITEASIKNTQQIVELKPEKTEPEPENPKLEANEFIITVKITTVEPEGDIYISEKLNGAISLISSMSSIKKVEVISIEK